MATSVVALEVSELRERIKSEGVFCRSTPLAEGARFSVWGAMVSVCQSGSGAVLLMASTAPLGGVIWEVLRILWSF